MIKTCYNSKLIMSLCVAMDDSFPTFANKRIDLLLFPVKY